MSVCPDCGYPFDGRHPERNCGAGPRSRFVSRGMDGVTVMEGEGHGEPLLEGRSEKRIANDDHQIISDGRTVWVNHSSGWCMGRFGMMGVDIHQEPTDQEGATQCLQCTHGPTTAQDWSDFQFGMLTHYGVVVDDKFRPLRFP